VSLECDPVFRVADVSGVNFVKVWELNDRKVLV
jgi:hypothetical protein